MSTGNRGLCLKHHQSPPPNAIGCKEDTKQLGQHCVCLKLRPLHAQLHFYAGDEARRLAWCMAVTAVMAHGACMVTPAHLPGTRTARCRSCSCRRRCSPRGSPCPHGVAPRMALLGPAGCTGRTSRQVSRGSAGRRTAQQRGPSERPVVGGEGGKAGQGGI